jgi:hypothetical protein
MNKKVFSIAPSFDCKLSCKGCYLTTGVTKEMRDLVRSDSYFTRSIETASREGYTEFAITWNPFPGAFQQTKKYVLYAKSLGMDTSVTTVMQCLHEMDEAFIKNLDILTISVDDMRFKNMYEFQQMKYAAFHSLELKFNNITDENGFTDEQFFREQFPHLGINYNLLWTPGVFEWLYKDTATFKDAIGEIQYPDTIQHLIYKPLSIYESEEWFWTNYRRVFTDFDWVNIAGNGQKYIGDIALNNLMGVNNCPGQDYQMIDVDPMGFARRCPENPDAYDVSNIAKLSKLLRNGTPCQFDACNCITG